MPVVVPLIIAGVSAAVTYFGQRKAGQAAEAAGESQAQQFEFNAGIAELQEQDAAQRGLEEEQRFRTSVRGLVGSQRAGFAGQNVAVHSGSAADVQADTAFLGELDARQIRANAAREAWGYDVQREDLTKGAAVARAGGQAARVAGNWAAAGTLLGAAGQGYSMVAHRNGWK